MQLSYKGNEKSDGSIELIIERALEIPDMYINKVTSFYECDFIIAFMVYNSMLFTL